MEASTLMNAHVQAKRIYNLLNETMDISLQIAEAMDRDDQIAVGMLVSMREEPVKKLRRARKALEEQRDALKPGEAEELSRLLNGGEPKTEAEEPLAAQVSTNRRLLSRLLELDKVLNRKLTRSESIYNQAT